jgi:hypothetical protein
MHRYTEQFQDFSDDTCHMFMNPHDWLQYDDGLDWQVGNKQDIWLMVFTYQTSRLNVKVPA